MSVAAGIDIGGTKCLGVALDGDGAVIEEIKVPTPQVADELVQRIAEVARRLPAADTLGVGLPGLVTRDGVMRASPNLPGPRSPFCRVCFSTRLEIATKTCAKAQPTELEANTGKP